MTNQEFQMEVMERFGRLEAHGEVQQKENAKQFELLRQIDRNGCAKGKELERRMNGHERAPARRAWAGATVGGGGIAAAIIAIKELVTYLGGK